MADVTLASLNFKMILDDKDFNEQITAVTNKAQQMNTEVSKLLEGLNKVSAGRGMSQSKKNEMLLTLRNDIKTTEAEIKALQRNLEKMWITFAGNGADAIMFPKTTKNIQDQSKRIDELRAKLAKLQEAYKKLGGDKALAASFKETKKAANDTNIELLRMREYYKGIAGSADTTAKAQKRVTQEAVRGEEAVRRQSRLWRDIKNYTMMYFTVAGASRLVSNLVQVSAEFEKQRVSLRAILQDISGADKIFNQIKSLAVESPFQFKELVTYTKQLSAFSIPMNELYDTTKMLADVSAGLGVGMDRLVLAYGQIRSASFLRGQEVRQLTEAGIPILRELSDMFTELEGHYVSAGDVFDKISKRQVTFEMVADVFKKMTTEGGKFYQMQEVLAATLSGKISNLKDAYQIMFAEIGEKNKGVLYNTVDLLRSVAENYEQIGRAIIELVAIYGSYRAALVAINALEMVSYQRKLATMAFFGGGGIITKTQAFSHAIGELARNTRLYQAANKALASVNPYALLVAAVAALGVRLYNLATRTTEFEKAQKSLNETLDESTSRMDAELGNLKYLFDRMGSLNAETKEYRDIKGQIINQYGDYLSDVDKEKLAVGDLTGLYDKLAASVKKVSMEKAASAARDKISEYVTEATADIRKIFNESLDRAGIDKASGIANELRDYIFGNIDSLSKEAEAAAQKISKQSWWRTAIKNLGLSLTGFGIFFDEAESISVDKLREMREGVNKEADSMREEMQDTLGWIEGAIKTPGEESPLTGWRKDLAAIVEEAKDAKAPLEIMIDSTSELTDVFKSVSHAIDESQERMERYRQAGEADLAKAEESRLTYLKRMQDRLGGPSASGGAGGGSLASADTTKEVVQNIQSQIRVYQRLREVYESLITTMSDEDARAFMGAIFPQYGNMVNANFDKRIEDLGDDLLMLAMSSDDAASAWLNYMDSMSDDKLKKYNDAVEEAKKNTENYKALLESWEGMMPSPEGLNKVISDYEKKLDEIEKLRTDSFEALWKERGNMTSEQYLQAFNQIHQKYLDAKDAQLNDAREKAEREIENIYKTWRDENLDFENLSDKTIAQLGDLKDAIKNFNFSSLKPEEQTLLLGLLGDLESIDKLIEKVKGGDIGKLKSEEKIKDIKAWRQLADSILDAAKSLKEYAKASNNVRLETIADAVSKTGELVKNVLNGFKNGDIAGAAVAGVSTIASWLLDAATSAAQLKAELAEIARQEYLDQIEARLKSADSIFGDRLVGHIRDVSREIKGLTKSLNNALNTEYLKASGKYIGDIFVSLNSDLQKYAYALNMTLKDSNGLFNKNTLDAIEEAYGKELKKNGLWDAFQALKDGSEELRKLMEDFESSVKSMFDDLSGDIADSLIESLKATGSAVTDLEDVFQGLGDAIFKSMVQSYIIDEVLNKYKDEVMSWWTDETLSEADIANRMREFADAVKNDIDLADDRLSAMYEAFMQNNLLSLGDGSEDGRLSSGIKSITEDTANLLASYVNAIRADVAAIRQEMAAQSGVLMPAPTLAEYLTQIQANTYNTAQNTADLLADLRSMMTISDGPALRVFM